MSKTVAQHREREKCRMVPACFFMKHKNDDAQQTIDFTKDFILFTNAIAKYVCDTHQKNIF